MGIVGALAAVVVAGVALATWYFGRRVRLKVEIDDARSEFRTVEVQRKVYNRAESETRTGITILLRVSNTSDRANTVGAIEIQPPVPYEPLPDGASFVTDIRTMPDPLYSASFTKEVLSFWVFPDGWSLPHRLQPAEQHEAGLTYLLIGDPQPGEKKLRVEIIVTDVYGKRYRTKVWLQHG